MNTKLYFDKIEEKFNKMSDEEFEQLLKDCGFGFEKVEQGEGGVFIKQSKRSEE